MAKQCGYCVYLDFASCKDGQFKCDKKNCMVFADSTEAENCREYCERYKRDFYIGDQAVKISKDYKESHQSYTSVGCYITTVVVNILGLPDDCEVLSTLRSFRKDVMQKDPNCKKLLINYDALGPVIARKISMLPNSSEVALDIYNCYLKGAVGSIKKGNSANAIALYSDMMNALMREYLSSYLIPDKVCDSYDMDSAGHGRITIK